MLACARIGAVHSVVFGGFAAKELATRIDDAEPKLVLTASCGIEPGRIVAYKPLLDHAIELATHKPGAVPRPAAAAGAGRADRRAATTTGRRPSPRPRRRADARRASSGRDRPALHPLHLRHDRRAEGRGARHRRLSRRARWSMANLYGVEPGEIFWTASDIGWVVGHSYIVYAPLLHGATTVLYEGKPVGTPDAGAFWRVIAEYKVVALLHRADRARAPCARRTRRRSCCRSIRPRLAAHAVPRRRARRPRHRRLGRDASSACPSSIIGGRPRPAGRSPPTRSGSA